MLSRGWRARMLWRLMMALAAVAALVAGLLATGGAMTARASGRGPCTPITAQDLTQPQVTPRGHAWAEPSRTQGTAGTLLSISGGGWPANASVAVEGWSDNGGQLLFDGALTQTKTTASGALQTPPFRMALGCEWLGWINSKVESATLLFVAHTVDGNFQTVSNRQSMLFTFLPSPLFNGAKPGESALAATHAGDPAPITSSGWAPGDRVTITALVAAWPQYGADSGQPPPVATPTSADDVSATTDSGGRFNLIYHLPDAAPLSSVALLLHTHDPRYGDVSIYLFEPIMLLPTVYPSALLAERTSLAGGTLTVTGDHWLPNYRVDIEYCRGLTRDRTNSLYCNKYAAQSLGEVTTDSTGHFFIQVHLPTNARLGDITVQARLSDADLWQIQDSRPFAAGQALTIVAPTIAPTYAQLHPRREWVIEHAGYFAAGAIALLALLGALAVWLLRRRRDGEARDAS